MMTQAVAFEGKWYLSAMESVGHSVASTLASVCILFSRYARFVITVPDHGRIMGDAPIRDPTAAVPQTGPPV